LKVDTNTGMSGTSSSLKRKSSVYDPKIHSSFDSTPTLLRRGAGPERAVVVGGARKHRHHLPIHVTLITFSMVHTTLQIDFNSGRCRVLLIAFPSATTARCRRRQRHLPANRNPGRLRKHVRFAAAFNKTRMSASLRR
jgi:hypothetical protein